LNTLIAGDTNSRSVVVERRREPVVAGLVFLFTLLLRVWGINTRFLLLGDQMRDWDIALRPLTGLPLVGPATHVHGYTIGPAFYWILWTIRVTIGPWFENLPHAGGIGQALLHSAGDALLLVAIWRRIGSMWVALATVIVIATAPFDLSLSAVVWNPTMGATLAKMATALILLDWHRRDDVRAVAAFGVAWMAVHAYTGAIYVVVAVFATALLDPLVRGDRKLALRNAAIIAAVVLALQVPYVVFRLSHPSEPAMAAVTGSVGQILAGQSTPQVNASVTGFMRAFNGIEIEPWHLAFSGWLLLVSGVIVGIRYRHDLPLVMMTLVPPLLALAGYSLFLSGLDNYYYLSLMPAAVLTVTLAIGAITPRRVAREVGVALVVLALAIVPARWRHAMTLNQMPEYGAIVHASRVVVNRGTAVRAIRTEFRLPPTNDPEFVYRILGGKLDPASPWVAVIQRSGDVTYRNLSAM
jgi:hypothetical protein